MTASVAMFGLMPAAFSREIGSQTQRPLAIVVIGGALCLIVVSRLLQPALLLLAHRKQLAKDSTDPSSASPSLGGVAANDLTA